MAKVRRKLRAAIRDVADGKPAPQPAVLFNNPIPTYGGDTLLRIPLQEGRDDGAILKEVAHKVAEIYMAADNLTGAERRAKIEADLEAYEATWS